MASEERSGQSAYDLVEVAEEKENAESSEHAEAESLRRLFAEFDVIDARIVKHQEETRKLGYETRAIMPDLSEIVAGLRASSERLQILPEGS